MMAETTTPKQPNPAGIMQVGMGFWASKLLLAAVKLEIFTLLAQEKMSAAKIQSNLNLQTTPRHVFDFLDGLVSLGFLEREGVLEKAIYSDTIETNIFLDKNKPSYMGGILEMANNRLYGYWGSLEEGLLTGKPQNESKSDGNMHFFEDLYKSPEKLQEFMDAMSGIQTGNFMVLTQKFPFGNYKSLVDVGGADGWLSILVAQKYPQLKCTSFDLPPVEPVAVKKIKHFGLQDRISFVGGDFITDQIPKGDIFTMGNILHGLNEESKMALVQKVYDALPENGVFMTIENVIDDDRRVNTFGMLMSLNMLIENGDAFDYTFSDFNKWVNKAGFKKTELMPLAGPTSAAIAYK